MAGSDAVDVAVAVGVRVAAAAVDVGVDATVGVGVPVAGGGCVAVGATGVFVATAATAREPVSAEAVSVSCPGSRAIEDRTMMAARPARIATLWIVLANSVIYSQQAGS